MMKKSAKKRNWASEYSFEFVEKNHKKSKEGRFQRKLQTAVSGTEHNVTAKTGKKHRKFFGSNYN